MFKKISITNFKSFFNLQDIELAPLTLIYGPNSSGKSSIIQSLMSMKYSLENRSPHAAPTFSGNAIDLGDYSSVVHRHDTSLDIEFRVEYVSSLDREEHYDEISSRPNFGKDDLRKLCLSYSHYDDGTGSVSYLNRLNFSCSQNRSGNNIVDFYVLNKKERRYGAERGSYFHIGADSIEGLYGYLKRRQPKLGQASTKLLIEALHSDLHLSADINLPIYSMVPEGGELMNSFLGQFFSETKYKFKNLKYLGPLRSAPKRFYSKSSDGEENIALKLIGGKREVINRVNYWFERFEVPYEISVEEVGNVVTGSILSVQLKDTRTQTIVTPADVGFGIGQVLPIIIESIVNRNTTICVEQPEIHLHPRLQAHLADLFIESIGNNNQWIIETHSEALLLRLQRRIRNHEFGLSIDQVKVSYVDCSEEGTSIYKLPMDNDGDFRVHWPDGFFEERLIERFGE